MYNMWTEMATFDIDKATKNNKKMINFGTYKGSGIYWGEGAANTKQYLGVILHMQLVKPEVLPNNMEIFM